MLQHKKRTETEEQCLFVIQTARFAAAHGLTLKNDAVTVEAKEALLSLDKWLIYAEIEKAFVDYRSGESCARFLSVLERIGFLELIFPEIKGMKELKQNPQWHPEGDVWTHTLQAVSRSFPSEKHRWAAFLHDIGKPACAEKKEGTDYYTFYGHAEVGANLVNEIATRLKFPTDVKDFVHDLVSFHMLPMGAYYTERKGYSYQTVRRFQKKVGSVLLPELAWLVRADQGNERFERDSLPLFVPLAEEVAMLPIPPVLLGRHLIATGIKEGPEIGILTKKAFDIQIDEGIVDVEILLNRVLGKE